MKKEELEKLYQERRLIKQLILLDRARYNYLVARYNEIKIKINSEFGSQVSSSEAEVARDANAPRTPLA